LNRLGNIIGAGAMVLAVIATLATLVLLLEKPTKEFQPIAAAMLLANASKWSKFIRQPRRGSNTKSN
jgi:hypothetical protein